MPYAAWRRRKLAEKIDELRRLIKELADEAERMARSPEHSEQPIAEVPDERWQAPEREVPGEVAGVPGRAAAVQAVRPEAGCRRHVAAQRVALAGGSYVSADGGQGHGRSVRI